MILQGRSIAARAAWFIAALFAVGSVESIAADLHPLWQVKSERHTLYLLGSIHLLRPEDQTLPAPILSAFAASKVIVLEMDMEKATADGTLRAIVEGGMLPKDETLEGVVGPEITATFVQHAKPLGLDVAMLSHFQPWLAAFTFDQVKLASLGYSADDGIDMQLARRAGQDKKRVIGLETPAQQLALFSGMSRDDQRAFLRDTLNEADRIEEQVGALVRAWKAGDAEQIAALSSEQFARDPKLARMLVTDRNRAWLPALVQLLEGDGDDAAMVVVGALHLVGTEGLIALLRQRGYAVVQL